MVKSHSKRSLTPNLEAMKVLMVLKIYSFNSCKKLSKKNLFTKTQKKNTQKVTNGIYVSYLLLRQFKIRTNNREARTLLIFLNRVSDQKTF